MTNPTNKRKKTITSKGSETPKEKNNSPANTTSAFGMGLADLIKPDISTDKESILKIDMNLIDEDPKQPRKTFNKEKLDELAASINERGLLQPITVRENGERYTIVIGARRFRACNSLKWQNIPAMLSNSLDKYDQISENIQRADHDAEEIAAFIKEELDANIKPSEIARKLGKSPAFVTQYSAFINLPPILLDIYKSGRSRDITLINDIKTLYKEEQKELERWINTPEQTINRTSFKYFKEYLEDLKNDGTNEADTEAREPEEKTTTPKELEIATDAHTVPRGGSSLEIKEKPEKQSNKDIFEDKSKKNLLAAKNEKQQKNDVNTEPEKELDGEDKTVPVELVTDESNAKKEKVLLKENELLFNDVSILTFNKTDDKDFIYYVTEAVKDYLR